MYPPVIPHWYYVSPPAGSSNEAQLRIPLNYHFHPGQEIPQLVFFIHYVSAPLVGTLSLSNETLKGACCLETGQLKEPICKCAIIQLLTSLYSTASVRTPAMCYYSDKHVQIHWKARGCKWTLVKCSDCVKCTWHSRCSSTVWGLSPCKKAGGFL